jgi:hypothetical protein
MIGPTGAVHLAPRWSVSLERERKSRPKAALNSNLMIVDHAAINTGFDF